MVAERMEHAPEPLDLRTDAFEDHGELPVRYTSEGDGVIPPISIRALPDRTASLTVIVEEPDTAEGPRVHWVAFNIPPLQKLPEGASRLGTTGTNSAGEAGYEPPAAPPGGGRYCFRVYACDQQLPLAAGATAAEVVAAMDGHVLGAGELVAHYSPR